MLGRISNQRTQVVCSPSTSLEFVVPAGGSAVTKVTGAAATVSMQALKGRASYLGPRSVGHEDPGAVSTALILGALRDAARAGR